jgi:iron complex outermembrane receptor protein
VSHARNAGKLGASLLLGIGSLLLSVPLYGQDDPNRPLPPAPFPSSASTTPTVISRSSATVSVLSGDDLNTLGVRSLADAFRIIPGMEVQKISATESSVSVRSYTGPSAASQGIQGMLDGRQVYNDFFGGVFWENIPVTMDEIKSVEVMRGPGSFLYGPNAMHGFINIKTKSPLDYASPDGSSHDIYLSASGGSYGANTESLTAVHCEGGTAIKVTMVHDDINQFEGNTDTRNKIFLDGRFETRIDSAQILEITAGASRQQFDVMFPDLFVFQGFPPVPSATYTTHADEFFAMLNYRVGDHLKIQISETHFTSDATPDGVYEPFSLVLDTVDVDAQYSFNIFAGHLITIGTGYRYATFITNDFDVANGRHATNLAGVFAQDEFSLWKQVFITAGARVDIHSTAGVSVSPRAAIVWQFVPEKKDDNERTIESGQSIRATAGTGFQNPSLREIWFNMPINPAGPPAPPVPPGSPTVAGNRDLKPQEMRSFEIGYWGRPVERLQVESSVYYNLTDRLAQFKPGPNNTVTRQNVDYEDAYGIEASVEYQLSKEVYVFGNYAYEIRQNRDNGDRIPSGPKNKANAGARVVNRDSLSGMLWVNFFDEVTFLDPNNTVQPAPSVPAYTIVNAKVWYPIKLGKADGRVFAQGFNLLDNVHKEHPNGDAYGLIAMAGFEIAW